jgi:flagellar hook-basal body complex protein FliE
MASPISGLGPIAPIAAPAAIRTEAAKPGEFLSALNSAIGAVEHSRAEANGAIGRLISGEGEVLHTTALAVQRAELSFDLFLQVRNKAVQAYQEVMRMQV